VTEENAMSLTRDNDEDGEFLVMEMTESTELRFRASDFRRERRFDVRQFVESDGYTGYTRKGLNIAKTDLPEFLRNFFQMLKENDCIRVIEETLNQVKKGLVIKNRGEESGEVGAESKPEA